MRTAREMYDYCKEHNFGRGFTERSALKHFEIIQNNLQPDETIEMVFIGLHNYEGIAKHDNNFAYAITNKRILMAQKRVIGMAFQSVSLKNINDITFTTGVAFGVITFDTIKECFNVAVDKSAAVSINNELHDVIERVTVDPDRTNREAKNKKITEEMEMLEEMLKRGWMKQEEFDEKRRQLLGL